MSWGTINYTKFSDRKQIISTNISERAINRTTTNRPVCSQAIHGLPLITEIFSETS